MNVNTKVLDILFRRVPPNRILTILRHEEYMVDPAQSQKRFQEFAVSELGEYSLDEQTEIFRKLCSDSSLYKLHNSRSGLGSNAQSDGLASLNMSLPALVFYKVLSLSEQVLTQKAMNPLCKIDQVFLWREMYLLLGQDVFVCAYLSQEDLRKNYSRDSFVWPAVLNSDHIQLQKILDQGLAENHQHLYGSSQTFALSWCSVMNYPDTHQLLDKSFDTLLQPMIIRGPENGLVSTKERVRYACLCRYILFSWLHIQDRQGKESEQEADLWKWFYKPNPEISVLNDITRLRIQYGARIPQRKGPAECLDYALEENIFQAAPDAAYRSLAGERSLLYRCFRHFLLGNMSGRMQWLFYLYLMLKALFRSELIQVNQQVGFRNFSDYQDRKDDLCGRACYQSELLRMAINAPLSEGHVVSLENRIAPKMTAEQDADRIKNLDAEKRFADLSLAQQQGPYWIDFSSSQDKDHGDDPYFFVYHFIKRPDKPAEKLPSYAMLCRHYALRRDIRAQSIAIATALERKEGVSQRLRGIDSASHEIGCPPEVFAPAFRYLRGFQHSRYFEKHLFSLDTPHLLSVTYHVGEDFLDITSALRAIDEAVVFLELRRGDRLGHTLGLGVEPIIHYQLKGNRVFVRKQDRLDDLVWLLFRGGELNLQLQEGLARKLENEAYSLLTEIYGDVIFKNKWHIDLHEYYYSMKLRADEPSCYIGMQFVPIDPNRHQFDEYALRKNDSSLDELRKRLNVAGMYYYYHYGREEKIRGSQTMEVVITPQYAEMIRHAQNCLQTELAAKGIIIECNPSSNVLIGTFGQYHRHPIFRFSPPFSRRQISCAESDDLQVCVNTDDSGVFDTSQAFEYALLYQALNEAYDENGQKRYTENDILDYLESLRQSGLAAVFPKVEKQRIMREGRYYERYHQRI